MAALTTLNITEKNANNSLSVTVKVNVTKEGVFTTTLSKEDVDKIHSYGIKLPTNRLGNEGYFVVSSGQLFFVDDEYAGTVKLTNLDNGESNISFPSCDDGLIINPADKHIK